MTDVTESASVPLHMLLLHLRRSVFVNVCCICDIQLRRFLC